MSSRKEAKRAREEEQARQAQETKERQAKRAQAQALKEIRNRTNVYFSYKRNWFIWNSEFSSVFVKASQENTRLTSLTLVGIRLELHAVAAIADFLKANSTSEEIRMEEEGLSPKGAEVVVLQEKGVLATLILEENWMGPEKAELLANALVVNTGLTKLSIKKGKWRTLPSNKIGSRGASAFARMLERNKSLTHLELPHNRIGHSGALDLGEALKINRALKHLDLSNNAVGNIAARTLIAAFNQNGTMRTLKLERSAAKGLEFRKKGTIENTREESALRTEVGEVLTKHGFEGLARGFFEDRIYTLEQTSEVTTEQLKSFGDVTLSERKRLKQLFVVELTLHERTPVGEMLASQGYEQYSRKFYDDGVYQVKPLTLAEIKEIGVLDEEDARSLHELFNNAYVDASRDSSQEESEEEGRVDDSRGQRPIVEVLPVSSEEYTEDEADKILKWHKLYTTGAITRSEFAKAKAKLFEEL